MLNTNSINVQGLTIVLVDVILFFICSICELFSILFDSIVITNFSKRSIISITFLQLVRLFTTNPTCIYFSCFSASCCCAKKHLFDIQNKLCNISGLSHCVISGPETKQLISIQSESVCFSVKISLTVCKNFVGCF